MKKMRKGKKMLLILIIAIVAVLAIVGIVNIVKNSKEPKEPEYEDQIISLPETVYSDMQVKDIHMEYLREQNKTKLRMTIDNTSTKTVSNESFNAIFIGPDDEILGQLPTSIEGELAVGDQYAVEVVLSGDLTSAKSIKLVEK